MIQLNTIPDTPITRRRPVVVGNGVAGARFVEDLAGTGCGSCHGESRGVNLLSGGREPSETAELPER